MVAVMMRVVVKVGLQGDKDKIKAMKAVSRIAYVDSVSADMEQKKLTVIGFFDPIVVVIKLRKYWHVAVVLIGPANEPGRGTMRQRREKLRRKELLMNRSPSLRRHNKNIEAYRQFFGYGVEIKKISLLPSADPQALTSLKEYSSLE